MNYLVDTHIFIWWLTSDRKLSQSYLTLLKDTHNHVYVSVASLWEISIKHSKGKLPLKTTLADMVRLSGFEVLSIELSHILQLVYIPKHHNDPFDRLLIAQAITEDLILITDDKKIKKYKLKTI